MSGHRVALAVTAVLLICASCGADANTAASTAASTSKPESTSVATSVAPTMPQTSEQRVAPTAASSVEVGVPAEKAMTPTRAPAEAPSARPAESAPDGTHAAVLRVIDGDTIEVDIAGTPTSVRYIGIDTPETVHPTRGEEPFGREASDANKEMVDGRTVLLVKDVSETDRYGRLLRYVFVEEGSDLLFVNLELVRRGFACASSYPPDVAHQARVRGS